MTDTKTQYTVLPDSTVADVETVKEETARTSPNGPAPRVARRLNEQKSRAEALKEQRTAIITAALDRRRQARAAEEQAAIDRARELAGTAEENIENGWVVASEVVIPKEYQRAYDDKRAKGYAMRFSWRKFRSIALNRRPDGTIVCVDGQHRLRAAQRVFGPDVKVPCTFTVVETSKEEAGDFGGINSDRSGLAPQTAYQARLHNEQPEAMRVERLLGEFGLRSLAVDETRGLRGTVAATRTVEYMLKAGGESSVRAVLSVLHDLWKDDASGYRDFILAGMWQFLVRYDGNIRRDRVITVLERLKSPTQLDELTAEQKTGVNSSPAVACCGAIHYLYNYNMKLGMALPPFSVESPARHAAMLRRSARRWVDKHEGGRGGAKKAGLWAPGGQLPYRARKTDRAPG